MADNQKGTINAATDGGVSGNHASVAPFEFLVGPTTSDQFNTARLELIPIACWRVDDVRFAFDSSFVNADPDPDNPNDIRAELRHLLDLVKNHPGAPLSVFGHADPAGSDDYNKLLSGRRAMAIYAVLVANGEPDRAVKLWNFVSGQEHWGKKQRDAMQTFTGLPSGTPDTTLFQSYLQKLCPPELKLTKKDFLALGADSGGKGDFQGCSEFNPVLLFSKEKQASFDQARQRNSQNDKAVIEEQNAENGPNRRVMVLMFRKGTHVDPAKWPCPRATEGIGGCKKRFWSDGEKKRNTHLPGKDRKFNETKDTFACRFYQRLLTNSPCESIPTVVKFRLFDPQARPLPFAPCLITEAGKQPKPARASGAPPPPLGTTAAGTPGATSTIDKADAFITLPVQNLPSTVNVKWSRPKATEGANAPLPDAKDTDDFEYQMDVAIDIPDPDPQAAARLQLKDLGYDTNPPTPIPGLGDPIVAFQRDYKPRFGDIVVDGTLSTPTINAVKTSHDAADPVLRAGSNIAMKR